MITSVTPNEPDDELNMSPGTWQQILDSFYGTKPTPQVDCVCEAPDNLLPQRIIGISPEQIDKDAYRDFMRSL